MKIILKIAISELKTLFYSPIAWLLLLIFLIQCGQFYIPRIEGLLSLQNMGKRYTDDIHHLTASIFGPLFGVFPSVIGKLYLYIPLLTMGLISRELSSGTIKLLYSSPLKISRIVFGKFFAMMIYNLILLGVVSILVLFCLITIKNVDAYYLLSGLLGIYLLLCTYASIGLFMSSLTSYQVVAAISTLAVFAFLSYVGALWQGIDYFRDVSFYLAMSDRTEHFLSGLIGSRDLIYFGVIIYMFLAFTLIKLNAEREKKEPVRLLRKYLFVIISAFVVGYLSNISYLTYYIDTTATKSNSLRPNTQALLKKFGEVPLEINMYVNLLDEHYGSGAPESRNGDKARWESYLRFKPDIKLKYIYYYDSTSRSKNLMAEFHDKSLRALALRIARINKVDLDNFKTPEEIKKDIDLSSEQNRYVMQLKYKGKTTFLRVFDDQSQLPAEAEIAAAFKRLLVDHIPVIGFLQDEYERSIDKFGGKDYKELVNDKSFRYSLINQGFDVQSISLVKEDIPAEVTTLVIADPKIKFHPSSIIKIQNYINRGGNLLIATEPGKQEVINPVLHILGIALKEGSIVQKSKDFTPDRVMLQVNKAALSISNSLQYIADKKALVNMPGVSALTYSANHLFSVTPLLTTDTSVNWNKKDKLTTDSIEVHYDPSSGDEKGVFTTLLSMQRSIAGHQQRILVAGDADFLNNDEFSNNNSGNFIFDVALFSWLSDNQFPVDVSHNKSLDNEVLLSETGFSILRMIIYVLLPAILFIMGTVFLLRRKNK